MTNRNDPRCVIHRSRAISLRPRARLGRWEDEGERVDVPDHLAVRCENVATTTITRMGRHGAQEIAVCQDCADREEA